MTMFVGKRGRMTHGMVIKCTRNIYGTCRLLGGWIGRLEETTCFHTEDTFLGVPWPETLRYLGNACRGGLLERLKTFCIIWLLCFLFICMNVLDGELIGFGTEAPPFLVIFISRSWLAWLLRSLNSIDSGILHTIVCIIVMYLRCV